MDTDQQRSAEHRVVCATCTDSGFEIMRHVNEHVVPVSEIVTLTPEQGERYGVAGYYSHEAYAAEHDIPVYVPTAYDMRNETDVDHFRERGGDVLIVHGWQRLVPGEILSAFTRGGLGLHGSAYGLPEGRGRSPMNWSLIGDLDRFLLSLFHLDEGADSGALVGTRKFDITDHDDIRTLYYKLAVTGQSLMDRHLLDVLDGTVEYGTQHGDPTYYPKRTPDDGAIDWRDPTKQVYNLVRAVTRPYPGAFTEYRGTRITLWEAQPFSSDVLADSPPGTILTVFAATDDFVVKTSDGTLLVTDWEAEGWAPEPGMEFESIQNDSIGSPNRYDSPDHEDSLSG